MDYRLLGASQTQASLEAGNRSDPLAQEPIPVPEEAVKKDLVNAWIEARRAEGLWVRCCLACGSWFAQRHNGRPGQLCDREICVRSFRYQKNNGRMPPDWLWLRWRTEVGDRARGTSSLRFEMAA